MTSPTQSSPSHFRPSRIAAMAGSVERSRSVSSIRSSILPPRPRAYSQLNSAVRAPPIWRKPVGEGAKRVTMESVITGRVGRPKEAGGVYQERCITKALRGSCNGLVVKRALLRRPWLDLANLAEGPREARTGTDDD